MKKIVQKHDRTPRFFGVVNKQNNFLGIVFAETKDEAERKILSLGYKGVKVYCSGKI